MVERIADPLPKCHGREEAVRLSKLIELRVSVQHSGRDELVKDTDDEWRKDSEHDVVERPCPGFVNDLSRVVVEQRILGQS